MYTIIDIIPEIIAGDIMIFIDLLKIIFPKSSQASTTVGPVIFWFGLMMPSIKNDIQFVLINTALTSILFFV